MNICRLKPDYHTCCSCIDTQLDTGEKKDCNLCPEYVWVKLLKLGSTIFGRDYAFVTGPTTNWTVQKVEAKRIGCHQYIADNGWQDSELSYKNNKLKLIAKKKEG